MLHTLEIIINLSRPKVVELFENPENLKHWQTGLQCFEYLSGKPGTKGATMKLDFMMGKRQIDLKETILKSNLPDEFSGNYECKNGWNTLNNRFIKKEENKTLWITETEMHFSGFMKVIGFLMPGTFKENSFKFMKNFKAFAEKYD